MILDSRAEFADGSAGTGSVANIPATINVGSTIDTQVGSLNLLNGIGDETFLVITIDTAVITGGTAGTIAFRLVSDSTAVPDLVTATVHYTSRAFVTDDIALAALQVGTIAVVVRLPSDLDYERYLGVQAIIATTTTMAGKINAFLSKDARVWKAYADAVN